MLRFAQCLTIARLENDALVPGDPHSIMSALATLPTELVTAALGHCDPLALLQLARTSKAWRARLLSRTAQPIWTTAFAEAFALGLPPIPTAVDAPTYASLLFEQTCTVCRC